MAAAAELLLETMRLDVKFRDRRISQLEAALEMVRLPGIILVTMPKSASVFLWTLLAKGLSAKQLSISNSYFPSDVVNHLRLRELASGNAVSQDHFPPSDMNLRFLKQSTSRIVLMVRK